MLKLAGSESDGTTTWMTGPKTLESHIIPSIHKAAGDAGRPAPIVVGGFPIVLTNDVDKARERIAKSLTVYGQLESYRAMLDREGARGPADIALVGDEQTLEAGLTRLRDMGVTHFNGAIMQVEEGAYDRTLSFLAAQAKG
jgi:5,10-methylenetetrahydromethanopterin reductase